MQTFSLWFFLSVSSVKKSTQVSELSEGLEQGTIFPRFSSSFIDDIFIMHFHNMERLKNGLEKYYIAEV